MDAERTASGEGEFTLALAAGVILTLLYVLVVVLSGGDARVVALVPAGAFLLLLQTRFSISVGALVTCLFLDVHLSLLSSAVVYAFVFALAFFLRHRDIDARAFRSPLGVPLLVYALCVLPSFINAVQPQMSAFLLLNAVAFVLVLLICVAALRTCDNLRLLASVYFAVATANALVVILEAAQGVRRPFGFAGIMFGDYAGLGLCVAAVIAVTTRGRSRLAAGALAVLLGISLLLSQTRNSWFAAFLTMAAFGAYAFLRPGVAGVRRKHVARAAVAAAVLVAGVGAAVIMLTPRVGARAIDLVDPGTIEVDEQGLVHNSLVTRAFIWDAALRAFRAHPIVGVGVYGFPYASRHYSTLPMAMYDFYIARNSPHQTYLAVLSETGLVGAFGYLVFLIATLRSAFTAVRRAQEDRTRRYALAALAALFYIVISMLFTDAWLMGQGIVLFALVLGSVLTLWKMSSAYRDYGVTA